jgi:hypothetical protein
VADVTAGDILFVVQIVLGQAVEQLVEALHYKPEGRGFDSGWCQGNCH